MVQQVKTCWLDFGWDTDGLEVTQSDSVLQVRWCKRKLYLIASTTCAEEGALSRASVSWLIVSGAEWSCA